MNPLLKKAAFALGGALLFATLFVVFSLVMGVPRHELAVVGSLFPSPEEAEDGGQATEAASDPRPVQRPPRPGAATAGLGVLDVFRLEAPFSTQELEKLVAELKTRRRELERRLEELDQREQRIVERSQFLDEQYQTLQTLRSGLEEWEAELEQRQIEVERDEAAERQREDEGWAQLARVFSEGDASEQGTKLTSYTPQEAARILHALKPARAKELLDALTGQQWKEYAEAYRLQTPEDSRP
jgi:hypothetical protein